MKILCTILFMLICSRFHGDNLLSLQDALIDVSNKIDKSTANVATKTNRNIDETPAAVTILTQKDLDRFQTVFDALRTLPGVFIQRGSSNTMSLNMRTVNFDSNNGKILLILNGFKLTDPASQSFLLRTLPLRSIRKIEILRGPNAVLYGSGAYNGVISISTFDGRKYDKNYAETDLGTDSNRAFRYRYNISENHMISFSGKSSSHLMDSPILKNRPGPANAPPMNDILNVFDRTEQEKSLLGFSKIGNLDITYGWGATEDENLYEMQIGNRNKVIEESNLNVQVFYGAKYNLEINAKSNLKISYRYLNSTQESEIETSMLETESGNSSISHQFEMQYHLKSSYRSELVFGFNRELINYSLYDNNIAKTHKKLGYYGYYIQNTNKIGGKLSLLSSLRIDNHPMIGTHSNPRFALIWKPSAKNTFKVIQSKAYKDPNPINTAKTNQQGQNDFFQLVTSQEYIWVMHQKKSDLSFHWFDNSFKDELSGRFSVLAYAKTKGFEATVKSRLSNRLFSHFSYTDYHRIRYLMNQKDSICGFTWGLDYKFGKRYQWRFCIDSSHTKSDAGNFNDSDNNKYDLTNVSLHFKQTKNHSLVLHISNLFDKDYSYLNYNPANIIPSVPSPFYNRRITLSWKVSF